MSIALIVSLILLFIVALVGTFIGLREEENKMKQHKTEMHTHAEDARETEAYEQKWLKTGLLKQAIIYGVAIILAVIIAFVIFM